MHENDGMLSSMKEFIHTNFSLVFFQGVFDQDSLHLDESSVIELIQKGSHSVAEKVKSKQQ